MTLLALRRRPTASDDLASVVEFRAPQCNKAGILLALEDRLLGGNALVGLLLDAVGPGPAITLIDNRTPRLGPLCADLVGGEHALPVRTASYHHHRQHHQDSHSPILRMSVRRGKDCSK